MKMSLGWVMVFIECGSMNIGFLKKEEEEECESFLRADMNKMSI